MDKDTSKELNKQVGLIRFQLISNITTLLVIVALHVTMLTFLIGFWKALGISLVILAILTYTIKRILVLKRALLWAKSMDKLLKVIKDKKD